MRKKTAAQLKRSGAKRDRIAKRTAEEVCPHELGAPPRPQGLRVPERRAWNKLVKELLARRVLARDDGPRILALIRIRANAYRGTKRGWKEAEALLAEFRAREPFPEATGTNSQAPRLPLSDFLAAVRLERETFTQRMVPDQTVCLDLIDGKPTAYAWPAGDAATTAREYCLAVTQDGIVACDLLRRACARTLLDMEDGAGRGLYYDPVAARNIARWYADFCGLKLADWQTWVVTSIFAWKKPGGTRRFSDAWISCGKKQGKTTLASGVGVFGLVADGEKFAEVYSAATKKDQARLIYRDAVRIVNANDELKAHVREFRTGSLVVEETDCTFQPLSSDVRSLDGLRPHFILADEIAEWESRHAWDKLCKGNVSRIQPLTFAITTAGESENCFAHNKHELAKKILTGTFPDDTTFVAVFQLDDGDDFKDEGCWPKANPCIGVTVQPEALRKILAEAIEDPSGQNAFQRYHCNRWVTFKQGRSVPIDKWDACRGADGDPMKLVEKLFEENSRTPVWGGIDLGLKEDLSAFVLLFKDFGTPITAIAAFWMPEVGLAEKQRRWGVPLSQWVRDGWIELADGEIVDPEFVQDGIAELCRGLNIHAIGYDDWNARVMASRLHEATGITIYEVPQKPSTLTQPAKLFKNAIWQKQIRHFGSPVLRWMVGNTVLEEDPRHEGIMPKKFSDNEKIDGVQALLSAWAVGIENPRYLKSGGNPTLA